MQRNDLIRIMTLSGLCADMGETLLRQQETIEKQAQRISELETMVIRLTKDETNASGDCR